MNPLDLTEIDMLHNQIYNLLDQYTSLLNSLSIKVSKIDKVTGLQIDHILTSAIVIEEDFNTLAGDLQDAFPEYDY